MKKQNKQKSIKKEIVCKKTITAARERQTDRQTDRERDEVLQL